MPPIQIWASRTHWKCHAKGLALPGCFWKLTHTLYIDVCTLSLKINDIFIPSSFLQDWALSQFFLQGVLNFDAHISQIFYPIHFCFPKIPFPFCQTWQYILVYIIYTHYDSTMPSISFLGKGPKISPWNIIVRSVDSSWLGNSDYSKESRSSNHFLRTHKIHQPSISTWKLLSGAPFS